jgi:hypothetical protein
MPNVRHCGDNPEKFQGDRPVRTAIRWFCLSVLLMTGCASIGPGAVTRDRFDYTAAVADSWKSQMLLNLVKIRYGDAPVFLDVGQIVAGYSFSRKLGATAGTSVFDGGNTNSIGTFGLSAEGTYNDSPTVTYAPLAGERFARSLMMPIPPSSIMSVVQAGFSVDWVFRLAVQSVNGIDNRRIRELNVQPADPEFYALLQNLRRIQNSGDIGMRLTQGDRQVQLEMVVRPRPAAAVENARSEVAKLLGLDPAGRAFRVVYGAVPGDDKEIAMLTRSIFEVLKDLAADIAVPEAEVAERRVWATPEADLGPEGPIPPMIRITCSAGRPGDAFVAVPYRGSWFSIDDRDIRSKNLFSFIMYLFTFVETGGKEATPVLTIPTTR